MVLPTLSPYHIYGLNNLTYNVRCVECRGNPEMEAQVVDKWTLLVSGQLAKQVRFKPTFKGTIINVAEALIMADIIPYLG